MTAAKRPQIENKPTHLLSKEENEQLFRLIGTRCKVFLICENMLKFKKNNSFYFV